MRPFPHPMLARTDVRQLLVLLSLAAAILGGQIQQEVLYSVDGIVYALVGKELAGRPLSEWAVLTWYGAPFYEHPHLTPWILGACMKVFGASTLTAIMPIALVSLATVILTYWLGRRLIDHRFGLLAATVLTLTPQFVKGGRNPMLEPALMFFVMSTMCAHLAVTRADRFVRGSLFTGVCLGLAVLAKGPPALLAPAVIVAFQCMAHVRPNAFSGLRLTPSRLVVHVAILAVVASAMVALIDVWHYTIAGSSFAAHYVSHQLRVTVIEGRGAAANDWLFYARVFVRGWPWWPVALLGVALVAWRRDSRAAPALALAGLTTLGTFWGFSLIAHKADWYVGIHHVGSSLLAALALRYLLSDHVIERYYVKAGIGVLAPLLFLSATVPSLFLQFDRPFERFMERAGTELGGRLEGEVLADCVPVEPWRGPFFLRFYMGVQRVDCEDSSARVQLVDSRTYVGEQGQRLVFSQHPFAIVERAAK